MGICYDLISNFYLVYGGTWNIIFDWNDGCMVIYDDVVEMIMLLAFIA
jgi:hypothetical protein